MSARCEPPFPYPLGVLDLVRPIGATLDLVGEAERLGYRRYWITEHPPQPNPQMTLALLAGTTDTIRVGTAGVLLRFRNPLETAQNFLMLEKLFPGRIDAGYCAGRSSHPLLDQALLDGRPDDCDDPARFAARAATFVQWLRRQPAPDGKPPIGVWSETEGTPQAWTFGTGRGSAELAARLGTAFGCSVFHGGGRENPAAAESYRQNFRPADGHSRPCVIVAAAGVCAETEARARELRREYASEFITPTIVGDPQQCREQLAALGDRFGADELVFLDVCQRFEDRLNCYRLLAEACGTIRLAEAA